MTTKEVASNYFNITKERTSPLRRNVRCNLSHFSVENYGTGCGPNRCTRSSDAWRSVNRFSRGMSNTRGHYVISCSVTLCCMNRRSLDNSIPLLVCV
jgi:hypothetical protein